MLLISPPKQRNLRGVIFLLSPNLLSAGYV